MRTQTRLRTTVTLPSIHQLTDWQTMISKLSSSLNPAIMLLPESITPLSRILCNDAVEVALEFARFERTLRMEFEARVLKV
jgi:hypothetical protein